MTRGEAIEILKTSTMKDTLSDQWQEAYKMAIKALSQEPKYRMAYDYSDRTVHKYVWMDCGWTEVEQEPCEWGRMTFDATTGISVFEFSDGTIKQVKQAELEQCDDAISRDELLKAIDTWDKFGYTETGCFVREPKGDYVPYIHYDDVIKCIKGMPSVTQKPIECEDVVSQILKIMWNCRGKHTTSIDKVKMEQIIRDELPFIPKKSGKCKDCKYFEYDSVAKVDGVPLIVAHEICNKWGDGCKTREDGYCFLFEPQESEEV